MSLVKTLVGQLANRIIAIGAAAAAAALLTYFRSEAHDGIDWLLAPVARHLPWHRKLSLPPNGPTANLASEMTVADVFLITPDGKSAKYEKAAEYVVLRGPLSGYREGVTSSGAAQCFSTELGVVVQTRPEHGFYVSHIDLGLILDSGAHFRNVYRVHLIDSFREEEEHWTQEVAMPTKHLVLRVHFPRERPPKLVRCKRIVGLIEHQTATAAKITDLFDHPAVVWEIPRPAPGDIYKLEWRW